MRITSLLFFVTATVCVAQPPTVAKLKELARNPASPEFEQALKAALKAPAIHDGKAIFQRIPVTVAGSATLTGLVFDDGATLTASALLDAGAPTLTLANLSFASTAAGNSRLVLGGSV